MSRIFISYKRVDKDKVFKIMDQIESTLNERCWIDLEGIESDAVFANKIIGAINDCELFLFMYSKSHREITDFENDWTIRELNFAQMQKKRVVFINIDGSELTDWFKLFFGTKQQVDGTKKGAIERLILDLKIWFRLESTSNCQSNSTTNDPVKKQLFSKLIFTIKGLIIVLFVISIVFIAVVLLGIFEEDVYVEFRCNEPSAILYIDGKEYGTPERKVYLTSGTHTIKVTAEGYNDYEEIIDVGKTSKDINLELSELDAKSLYSLGLQYYKDNNYIEAVKWLRRSADQGNALAQCFLGYCYEMGQGVTQDYSVAVKWYRKSADQGDADAQVNLGLCYEFGRGVTQDRSEAVKWYRSSADQGHPIAQCNLGDCYYNGQGLKQDYSEAVKWFKMSANLGYARAQCFLGYCYEKGQGVTQDYSEATRWYRTSADQGYATAQNNLGCCYEFGIGVTQDKDEAVEWYKKAARQGYTPAQDKLITLGISEW